MVSVISPALSAASRSDRSESVRATGVLLLVIPAGTRRDSRRWPTRWWTLKPTYTRSRDANLLPGSFVPDPVFRRLRDLTRYRRRLVEAHTAEAHRLTKVLEDVGTKLDSVACKTLTLSGRRMIEALCDGERDPVVLADLAMRWLRSKIPNCGSPSSVASMTTTR